MRTSFQFRSLLMGNQKVALTYLCNVETGEMVSIYTTENNQSIEDYYSYSDSSYNGPDVENNTILVRWYKNTLTDELGLIIVTKGDDTNSYGPVNIIISNLNSGAYIAVADEPGEVELIGNTVYCTFNFNSGNTDGVAISGIDSGSISNFEFSFDNPYNEIKVKFQTLPDEYVYINSDKLENFNFKASNSSACDRYVYPDGEAIIVNTTAEFNAATISVSPPTQQEIFDTWDRYAGPDFYPSDGSNSGSGSDTEIESQSWEYDSVNDQIISTVNSSYYIGFVSPDLLDRYDTTVTFGSTDDDDDTIGLVIAFVLEGGIPTSLCAVRTNGGTLSGTTWAIVKITGNTADILVDGSALAPSTQTNPGGTGWQGSGSTTVRVKRTGNNITVYCSQFGSTSVKSSTKLTYTIPDSDIFDLPCAYGYMCRSQLATYFDIIKFTGGLDLTTVYDVRTTPYKVYEYVSPNWVYNSSRNIFDELGQPRTITNPTTDKQYYLDNDVVTLTS
jgi:hypothetical protein